MFKKRITPFALAVTVLITALVTAVATGSALSVKHKSEVNDARNEAAGFSDYADLITLIGDDGDKYKKLANMIDIIEGNYVREYDSDEAWENLCKALVASLADDYSQYLTLEEYQSLLDSGDGGFVGIGVHAVRDPDSYGVYIFGVIPDSPAEAAGIKKGDIIVKVDELGVTEDNYYEFIDAIAGEAGSSVKLTLLRGDERIEITCERAAVKSENVLYEKLESDIAYIRILSFADDTVSEEFSDVMNRAVKDGCSKYIFDVRNNAGGYLEEICDVLDILLPEGPIINIVDKNKNTKTYNSDKECIEGEFTVLCDGATASAAELFTAALRDYGLAKTVGINTFGKGTMQTTRMLEDGSAIKISTAYYNPPKNVSYDGIGIKPDFEIEYPEEWQGKLYQMPSSEDVHLQKALEILTSAK